MAPRGLSAYEAAMAAGGLESLTATPTVISCAVHMARMPSRQALHDLITHHLVKFDTFASRPVNGKWVPVESLDVKQHLFFVEVRTEADLLAWMEAAMLKPLVNKQNGPWWEIHAVSTADGQAWLFFRVEHVCADGVGLSQVLSRVATMLDGSPLPASAYAKRPKPEVNFCATACAAIKCAIKYAVLPFGVFDSDLPFSPPRSERTRGLNFRGPRRLLKVPPHSLETVKRIKEAAGGTTTVNDVVYAAFTYALRRYCLMREEKGTSAAKVDSRTRARVLVPVAFPRPADSPLVNDWTFVNSELPISETTPQAMLAKANETFDALKQSPEAKVSQLAVAANANNPTCMFAMAAQQLFSRHSFVYSNVPGPTSRLKVAGEEVLEIWPIFPNLISQLLCVSYAGKMYMTIVLDASVVTEAEVIPNYYLEALRELAQSYGVKSAV